MTALKQFCALAGCAWRESVRMKSFLVLAFLAVCAMALSPFLPSDGTPQGRLRIAISACMWSAAFFATVMAVLLPALLLSREHDTRSIFVLATKPVRPGMIVLGKAGGALMVGAAFLAAGGLLTWFVARVLAWGSPEILDDCFVLRRSLRAVRETGALIRPIEVRTDGSLLFPLPPGAKEAVLELQGRAGERVRVGFPKADRAVEVVLGDQGDQGAQVPVPAAALGEKALELRLTPPVARALLRAGGAAYLAPGEKYEWEFRVPECGGGARLRVRAYAGMTATFESRVQLRGEGWSHDERVKFHPERPSVVRLPAGVRGRLSAVLVNESRFSVRVVEGKSAEFLVPAGSLAGGLLKDFVAELSTIAFVALGTAMVASFSSFPVAACWGLFLAIAGHMSGMVLEVLSHPAVVVHGGHGGHGGHAHAERLPTVVTLVMRVVARAIPDLSAYDPTEAIVEGVQFPWTLILTGLFSVAVLRGGICGAVGWLIYSGRELGK